MTSRSDGSPSDRNCPPGRHLTRQPQRGDQALGARTTSAGDCKGSSMIRRGPHEGQSERGIHPAIEVDRLDRDQRLIMIHAQCGVKSRTRLEVKHGVGGQWATHLYPGSAQLGDSRFDDLDLFTSETTGLSGMRIETGDDECWGGYAEIPP